MSQTKLNRRHFIGSVGLVSGGIAVTAVMPWTSGPVHSAQPTLAKLTDWTIDDMWGVYPRYAESIGYARPQEPVEQAAAAAGSIEALLYA